MKKSVKTIMTIVAVVALVAILSVAFAACNKPSSTPNPLLSATKLSDFENKIGAYENGSAGEALYAGFKEAGALTGKGCTSQIEALLSVKSGQSQFAIVDLLLASAKCGKGDFADLSIVQNVKGETEKYAVGFKKGNPLTAQVNTVFKQFLADGTIAALAEKYGLTEAYVKDYSSEKVNEATLPEIVPNSKGTITIACTEFEPMNFDMDKTVKKGFDTELAIKVFKKLGYENIVFKVINWDLKYTMLEADTVQCLWNGFTANSNDADGIARSEKVDFTYSYMNNYQAVVTKGTI